MIWPARGHNRRKTENGGDSSHERKKGGIQSETRQKHQKGENVCGVLGGQGQVVSKRTDKFLQIHILHHKTKRYTTPSLLKTNKGEP